MHVKTVGLKMKLFLKFLFQMSWFSSDSLEIFNSLKNNFAFLSCLWKSLFVFSRRKLILIVIYAKIRLIEITNSF